MQNEIIIKEENLNRINDAIYEAEGKATARTISAEKMLERAEEITRYLGIPKTTLEGTEADIDPWARDFPQTYHYVPYSTQYTMHFSKGSWRLTNVRRAATQPERRKVHLKLSETAKAAVLYKISMYK